MTRLFLLFVFLPPLATVRAQEAVGELPTVTPAHFSRIVGSYRINSSAAPLEVAVEEPITLTVEIKGTGPEKYHPARPNLHIFPDDVAASFHIEPVPEQDKSLPREGRWLFVYRLRPKYAHVKVIPELQLVFLPAGATECQSSFADEIPIKVTQRQEATAEKLDLKIVQAPARFYQLRPVAEVLRNDTPLPSPGLVELGVLAVLPPLLCLAGSWLWRRLHPSAAQRRHRRRSRAARVALASLAKRQGDVPNTRAAAVHFLRQRFDLAALEPTPAEVSRHLRRLGMAKPLVADWSTFLKTCDCYQFAPLPAPVEKPMNAEAVRLIEAVEADPCEPQ